MRFAMNSGFNRLSVKVLMAYVAGVLLSIALVVLATVILFRGNALAKADLEDAAKHMANLVRFDVHGRPASLTADEQDTAWVFDSLRHEAAYRVLDDTGQRVLQSSAGDAFWTTAAAVSSLERGCFAFVYDGNDIQGVTEPFWHEGRAWYFQIAVSTRMMKLMHRIALPLAGIGIGVFSLVLLITFGLFAGFTLKYTLKPLRKVSESAAIISPRSMHARLDADAVPAEIAPLVVSFNRVLERLERGYRVQQEFLANAAHELKTPLSLMRAQLDQFSGSAHGQGSAEAGVRSINHLDDDVETRKALLSDVDYMTRQVQQLLILAEASETTNYSFAPVDVYGLANDAVAYLQRMAETAHVRIEVIGDPVVWQADRGALFTLLKNLLENALQHAPRDTAVSIEISPTGISVRDRGPGVDATQLPLLFDRFWRGAHRRDRGAGLGLAICQEIACAHGWQLRAERAEPGLCLRLLRL